MVNMRVTIIGNGNMAKGIATRLLTGRHSVAIHARDIQKANSLIEALKSTDTGADIHSAALGSEAETIIILTVPYSEVEDIAKQYDGFAGKTLVDITNPVDFATFQLIPEAGTSGAEAIAKIIPDASVIKGFNTVFAGTLISGKVDEKELDVFIAGDDQPNKDEVKELINSSGMRAVDVGPLANSRHLEGLALIHMSVQDQLQTGWMSAIKIIS